MLQPGLKIEPVAINNFVYSTSMWVWFLYVRMGMQQENVSGWDEFSKLMTRLEERDVPIYVLFVGETLAETGKNWCPDCVKGIDVMPACVVFYFRQNGFYFHLWGNLHVFDPVCYVKVSAKARE